MKFIRMKSVVFEFFRLTWWLLPIAFMALIFFSFYYGYFPLKGEGLEQRGQFGDSFGVLNSLFSGLGFGGLIVTLLLQQKQIRQQEKQITAQQESDLVRHYEDTLYHLLSKYQEILGEVANSRANLRGRSVLRGSTDRVFEALKKEGVHLIPHVIQDRYNSGRLTSEDVLELDYLYFRNFKILSVEIDRQARLIETLKVLLRHLIYRAPSHVSLETYKALVFSQITHVEISYFFLVALAFNNEASLRDLLLESGLLFKAANVKRLRIHDYMYQQFWGQDIRSYKEATHLPIGEKRIDLAIRAHRKRYGLQKGDDLRVYSSPRVKPLGSEGD
jgi:hypothetical protein